MQKSFRFTNASIKALPANTDTFFGTVECVAQEETFVTRST